jgi:hypothetical protein
VPDLEKALAEITLIRSQMARGMEFRGLGAATLAATGGLALLGALAQALWLEEPARHVESYLVLWLGIAAASVLLIGALMTFVLYETAPMVLWTLPGLWQIVFGLGVFASRSSLPPAIASAGVWYLASGLACLATAGGDHAFSPWAMGLPFGIGQMLIALIVHRQGGGADGEA